MKKSVKWILILLGVVVVVLLLTRRGGNKGEVRVTAEKATLRTITETVSASGKIYPEVEVKISPDISGEITELTVQEGDSVRRGQVLARIYADIYSSQRDEAAARVAQSQATVANSEASLQAVKAQLDQDRQNYERNKQLYDEKVISKAELEQFETKYRTGQAQYEAARQNIRSLQAGTQSTRTSLQAANKNLGRTTLVAPMDGIISVLNVKKGERVAGNSFNVGTEMMRVANMNTLEVRVDVGENDIVKVKVGDTADVEVEAYNKRKFKGVVTQIASSTARTGAAALTTSANDVTNYEVRIRLDPASYSDLIDRAQPRRFPFRPGMNASVEIRTRQIQNVLSVPIGAVAARVRGSDTSAEDKKKEREKAEENTDAAPPAGDDLEEVVFVIGTDGKAEKRIVTTGIQDMNFIEVRSGLKGGEQVVTAPYTAVSRSLRSGAQVKVVAQDKLFEKE